MKPGKIIQLSVVLLLCFSTMALVIGNISGVDGEDGTRHSGDELDCRYSRNDVTINGIIGPGEWDDANYINITTDTGIVSLNYKFDDESLLLLFSHEDNMENIYLDLFFDTNNDGTNQPGSDDINIHTSTSSWENFGTGSAWNPAPTASGWAVSGAYSDSVEISVKLSKLGITPGVNRTIGFACSVLGSTWPAGADRYDTGTWGDMYSSDNWEENINVAPTLEYGGVTPDKAFSSDPFEFSVIYRDADDDPPAQADVVISGSTYSMESSDTSYDNGAEFSMSTLLPSGTHQYYFIFNDSMAEARFPETGYLEGPNVISPNTPPELIAGGIPLDEFTIPEDSGQGDNLIDLEVYFTDDRDDGNLTFEVTYQEDPYLISAVLDGHYLDVYQVKEDWHGSKEFQVKAIDRGVEGYPPDLYRLETLSNIFTIEISPVNDAPEIVMVGDIEVMDEEMITFPGPIGAVEDSWFNISVTVQDPDIRLGTEDTISYFLSSDRLTITPDGDDSREATISFLPTDVDVGFVETTLSISDEDGDTDSIVIKIEVTNTNDDPYITHIVLDDGMGESREIVDGAIELTGDDRAYQKSWYNFTIIAHDDDVAAGIGDILLFGIQGAPSTMSLDPNTGEVSFLPDQDDVGLNTFEIWVSDGTVDGQDRKVTITLDVEDVNDDPAPPEIFSETGLFSFYKGTQKNLTVLSYDIDPDDELTYEWFSDIDGSIGTGSKISISNLSVGMHNITVVVKDSRGATSVSTRQVSISYRPEPEGPLTGSDGDSRSYGLIIALLIGGVVLLFLALFAYGRIKKKNALDHVNRKMIYEMIKDDPGVHFSAISEMLDLKQGVLSHHLNVLEKNEFIRSLQDGKYRRFYLFDERTDYKIALTAVQQRILFVVMQEPGISQAGISNATGRNSMVVNYHVRILRDIGLLSIEREGRETHCFITSTAANYFSA